MDGALIILQVWAGQLSRHRKAVLLLNRGTTSSASITAAWPDVGIRRGVTVEARDVWKVRECFLPVAQIHAMQAACGLWFVVSSALCSTRRSRAGSPAASRRWSGRTRASSSSSRPFLADDGAAGEIHPSMWPWMWILLEAKRV